MTENRSWPDEAIYALRTAQQHHVQLSLMADHKANLLMGATFIVFTLAIGQSRMGIGLSLPLIILAIFAFLSAVLAALAVMPAVGRPKQAEPNWLFFGAFSQVTEDEYLEKMLEEQFDSPETTYRAMLRDVYQMGNVLAKKKYRYLGWAYRVFLVGLLVTLLTYLIEQATGPFI